MVSKRIIYLGINLALEVQDLYTKIYNTLLKETKELNKCIHIPCSWVRRQCCYNDNTSQTDSTQYWQKFSCLLCRNWQDGSTIHMEMQGAKLEDSNVPISKLTTKL